MPCISLRISRWAPPHYTKYLPMPMQYHTYTASREADILSRGCCGGSPCDLVRSSAAGWPRCPCHVLELGRLICLYSSNTQFEFSLPNPRTLRFPSPYRGCMRLEATTRVAAPPCFRLRLPAPYAPRLSRTPAYDSTPSRWHHLHTYPYLRPRPQGCIFASGAVNAQIRLRSTLQSAALVQQAGYYPISWIGHSALYARPGSVAACLLLLHDGTAWPKPWDAVACNASPDCRRSTRVQSPKFIVAQRNPWQTLTRSRVPDGRGLASRPSPAVPVEKGSRTSELPAHSPV